MTRISKQLIPLDYVNEACFVSNNIDHKKLSASLVFAQLDLQDLLGTEFYLEIESQYAASGGTLSSDNETLYENYIKDYLAWQTYFYSLGFSQTESTPTGERTFKDDNSELATDIQLFSKEKNIKEAAFKFQSAMINFLRISQHNNSTKYPKWEDKCREDFQFGISAIGRERDEIFAVRKAINNNE